MGFKHRWCQPCTVYLPCHGHIDSIKISAVFIYINIRTSTHRSYALQTNLPKHKNLHYTFRKNFLYHSRSSSSACSWWTYCMLEVVVQEPCSRHSAPVPSKIGLFPQEKCVLLLSSYTNNTDRNLVAQEILLYAQISFWSLLNLHSCSTALSVRKTNGLCLIDCGRRNLCVKIKHK